MGISTAKRRSAALRFGHGPTTKPPSNTLLLTQFDRMVLLSCYPVGILEVPIRIVSFSVSISRVIYI